MSQVSMMFEMSRQEKWDRRWLGWAHDAASWSKDPSTKVGAVLINADNRIMAAGYNGFRPGADDSAALYADREYKYANVIHAEQNALETLGPLGSVTAAGFTLYTSFPCCPKCMRLAGTAGVTRVVSAPVNLAGRGLPWIKEWSANLLETEKVAAEFGIAWCPLHV